jgi:hypothetical protein
MKHVTYLNAYSKIRIGHKRFRDVFFIQFMKKCIDAEETYEGQSTIN